ncbi:DUF742 domain-containing protein [Streptomyces sp. BE147]|uniref:DUF742 domain-containing protein n=1 Tax=Streptomyces sp. BE147 TaxID=3002524 RepID=UPI002E7A2BFC|nr:DUF742 domain-containing protein [Streptomyces sp. BE147]MEE1741167.1 DUF742 domain-containing protein [Streptomyces sp. BE147]
MGAKEVWLRTDTADVRPYGLTGGRTEPALPLPPGTLLTVRAEAKPFTAAGPESTTVLRLCAQGPCSVAEIVGVLRECGVPVLAVKVLLSDLIDAGILDLVAAVPGAGSDPALLRQVLNGMRNAWPDARSYVSGGGHAAA